MYPTTGNLVFSYRRFFGWAAHLGNAWLGPDSPWRQKGGLGGWSIGLRARWMLGRGVWFAGWLGACLVLLAGGASAQSPSGAEGSAVAGEISALRQQALQAFREGRFEDARAIYQTAVTPQRVRALLGRYRAVERDGVLWVEISVKEVLQLTMELSTTIAALRIAEEAERRQVSSVKQRRKPTWLHQYADRRTFARMGAGIPPTISLQRSNITTLTSTFSQKLPWGLGYALSLHDRKKKVDTLSIRDGANPRVTPGTLTQTNRTLSAQIDIPLGKDFGEVDSTPERKAYQALVGAHHTLREQELALLKTMATLYWGLLGNQEQVKTREESLALSMRLLAENQARFKAGVINRSAVLASRTQVVNDKRELLRAQAALQRLQDSARAALNLRSINLGLVPKERFTKTFPNYQASAVKQRVLDHSPTLGRLRAEFNTLSLSLEESKNRLRPEIDLSLRYSQNGFGNGAAPSPGGGELSGYQALLSWNMTFFDAPNKDALFASALRRESVRLRIGDQESVLLVNLNSQIRELEIAEKEIEVTSEQSKLAKLERDNEVVRLGQGQSTSSTVAGLQRDFSQAKVNEILARVNYEQKRIEFLVMTGELYDVFELQSSIRKPLR